MPSLGTPEILILLLVLVLLFGATRLPKAAEGIGKALRVFKREVRNDDDTNTDTTTTAQAEQTPPAVSQQANGTAPQATTPAAQKTEQPKQ